MPHWVNKHIKMLQNFIIPWRSYSSSMKKLFNCSFFPHLNIKKLQNLIIPWKINLSVPFCSFKPISQNWLKYSRFNSHWQWHNLHHLSHQTPPGDLVIMRDKNKIHPTETCYMVPFRQYFRHVNSNELWPIHNGQQSFQSRNSKRWS